MVARAAAAVDVRLPPILDAVGAVEARAAEPADTVVRQALRVAGAGLVGADELGGRAGGRAAGGGAGAAAVWAQRRAV